MGFIPGVNLLPSTGEFAYDPLPYQATLAPPTASGRTLKPVNLWAGPGGTKTDYSYALDQLAAAHPECGTVNLIVSWFGSSIDASQCKIYPSTIYIGGSFQRLGASAPVEENWQVSGLTQLSADASGASVLRPITTIGGHAVYGGTPSDQSVVRCIRDLKARGYRVTFYPFLLMDCPGFPWRGRIGYGADVSQAAADAVAAFLGPAQPSQFSRDATNLTVGYSGSLTDYSFRRFILHSANLCALAGGVDLFLIGSELRGLETIRGPGWTKAGGVDSNGCATWDYPFVAGLCRLADDVRSVFDGAGLAKDLAGLHNLVAYSADWSVWMGYQHPGAAGQWPHLDALWARPSIDLVSIDDYMPLSDWTTAGGGLDAQNWDAPAPTSWPPPIATMGNLGLTGEPTLYSLPYLKANIEGAEKFSWFYYDSDNLGRGLDPLGTDLQVSRPAGDRATQTRSPYYPGQEILANKRFRWWWKHQHFAVYDAGDGQGYAPHGPPTAWQPQSKSLTFAEYGFPTLDRGTNQPNVFFDPKSTESFTPFWSVWEGQDGAGYRPRRDDTLSAMALQAVYEYWFLDGHNETSPTGLPLIQTAFMAAWNWDARPFPVFPLRGDVWGDASNWPAGNWLGGKGPSLPPPPPDAVPVPGPYPTFPTLAGQGWSVTYAPTWSTAMAGHVSGREARAARYGAPRWEVELGFNVLRAGALGTDLAALAGFFASARGQASPFWLAVPASLGAGAALLCRFADDDLDLEEFMALLFATGSFKLVSVRP